MITLPRIASPPLCRTFAAQAEKIWDDLWAARISGINRSEETITDDFLLDVQLAHPSEVTTFQFNKHEESFTGADWEWWLTDGRQWLGLLIQAKRLGPKSHKYETIRHWVRSAGMWQIDRLQRQASLKRIEPLYCFFNYSSAWPLALTWKCCAAPRGPQRFGCTVAHATAVKGQLGQGGAGLPKMSRVSYPLACLVCCLGPTDPARTLPVRAYDVTARLRMMADMDVDAPSKGEEIGALRGSPPSYVERLLDCPPEQRPRVIEEIRHEAGEIGSLIVIREQPSV
jgi:hypothetical protein